jgi:hypothetical protein
MDHYVNDREQSMLTLALLFLMAVISSLMIVAAVYRM